MILLPRAYFHIPPLAERTIKIKRNQLIKGLINIMVQISRIYHNIDKNLRHKNS